jgi:hypothetical protein
MQDVEVERTIVPAEQKEFDMSEVENFFTDGEAYERRMGRWSRIVGEAFLNSLRLAQSTAGYPLASPGVTGAVGPPSRFNPDDPAARSSRPACLPGLFS